MKLKTLCEDGRTVLQDYSEAECFRILEERDDYVLLCVRRFGRDYGGSQCSENTEISYREIVPERVLVKDGHFCGVSMIVDYSSYNGSGMHRLNEVCLFTGSGERAREGVEFSNDDHDRWDFTDYSLVKRPEEASCGGTESE